MNQFEITNGSRKVIVTSQDENVHARLYVNNGETATTTSWDGKTETGARKWARKILAKLEHGGTNKAYESAPANIKALMDSEQHRKNPPTLIYECLGGESNPAATMLTAKILLSLETNDWAFKKFNRYNDQEGL